MPVTNNYRGTLHLGTQFVTHQATDTWNDTGFAKQKILVQPGDALGGPVENEIKGEGEIIGTSERDLIIATDSSLIWAGEGDDLIIGSDADDEIRGDDYAGSDVSSGGEGNDQIFYFTGKDQLFGDEGNDWFGLFWNSGFWDSALGEMFQPDPADHSVLAKGGSGNDSFLVETMAAVEIFDDQGDESYVLHFVPALCTIIDEAGNDFYHYRHLYEVWYQFIDTPWLKGINQLLTIEDKAGEDRFRVGEWDYSLSYTDVYWHRDNDDLLIGDLDNVLIRIRNQFAGSPIEAFEFSQGPHGQVGEDGVPLDPGHNFYGDDNSFPYEIEGLDPLVLTDTNIETLFSNIAVVADTYVMGQELRRYERSPRIRPNGILTDNRTLQLGAGFTPENTRVHTLSHEPGLLLKHQNNADWLFLANAGGFAFTQYESIQFADGTVWAVSAIENVTELDTSAITLPPIEPILAYVNQPLTWRLPDGFIQSSYSGNRKDFGGVLYENPDWLTLSSDDFVLTGTPTVADIGESEPELGVYGRFFEAYHFQRLRLLVLNPSADLAFASTPALAGIVGQNFIYQPQVSHASNTTLQYRLLVAPPGMEVDTMTGAIRWEPGLNHRGPQRAMLTT